MSKPLTADSADVPAGFERISHGGPYFAALGPVYGKPAADGSGTVVVALRVEDKHTNVLGVTHGGMLATLADCALGMNVVLSRKPQQSMVTVSLTSDFLSSAKPGEWLEAHVTVRRQGARLAFAECLLKVAERVILRASGVFSLTGRSPVAKL